MKVRFNRWYNAVLTALLGMLGYSCADDSDENGIVAMYGVPSADYVIKGQVTDEAGTPVNGIKTSLKMIFPEGYFYGRDSTLTDAAGQYELVSRGDLLSEYDKLIVEDIDGEANGGEFQSDTISLSNKDAKQVEKGSGAWYQGKYELTKDIILKKKNQETAE